jgi:hypothetical protein
MTSMSAIEAAFFGTLGHDSEAKSAAESEVVFAFGLPVWRR